MRIIQRKNRFVIVDDNNVVMDDANGHGYKTDDAARKAMWYNFKGGKDKINSFEIDYNSWIQIQENKDMLDDFDKTVNSKMKEIGNMKCTINDILDEVEIMHGRKFPFFVRKLKTN